MQDFEYKIPPPYTTSFEFAKAVGMRSLQLASGDPPKVEFKGQFNPILIAKDEIYAGLLPFIVIRKLPNGTEERFDLTQMVIRDH